MNFFVLEGGYLVIALFFLVVTAIVTTRSFIPEGSFKKIFPAVFIFFAIAIGAHYYVTTGRMNDVKEGFENGKTIICESRAVRGASRTVMIEKGRNWKLSEDYLFTSPEYVRGFHAARCIVDIFNKEGVIE